MLSKAVVLVNPSFNKRQIKQFAGELADTIVAIDAEFNRSQFKSSLRKFIKGHIRALTAEERVSVIKAQEFTTSEFKKLGFSRFPKVLGLVSNDGYSKIAESAPKATDLGAAFMDTRSMFIKDELAKKNPVVSESVFVHEFTHLVAPIRLSSNTWISMGLQMSGSGDIRFSLLEEFVAEVVSTRYLLSCAFEESTSTEKIKLISGSMNPVMKLFCITHAALYQTEHYLKSPVKYNKFLKDIDKLKNLKQLRSRMAIINPIELLPDQIDFKVQILNHPQNKCRSAYSIAVQSMLDLGREVTAFHNQGSEITCREMYENKLLIYQQSGDTKAAISYFVEALGKSIVSPLAFLDPASARDNLLLKMYVDARKVQDPKLKQEIRFAVSLLARLREKLFLKTKV